MDLRRYPDLLDRLAGEYALGTLRGGARRRLRSYAERDPVVRIALERWQRRLDAMAELAQPVAPPPSVWTAIAHRLRSETTQAAPVRPAGRSATFWRAWAVAASACAVAAVVVALVAPVRNLFEPVPVARQEAATSAGQLQVAVLNDTQGHATLLVTWNEQQRTVAMHPLVPVETPAGKAMELWGLPTQGHPVSLGLLPAGVAGTIAARHDPHAYAQLAVSLEPPGGSTNPAGPSGPVLFVGKLVPAT
ncbi:anti-sigma factor [Paraburkholderia sp.]|uniref:anti-sigma factor n=1 Tax=Paraburkholderia sp. TaxID=1926495 RepID=UPI003D6F6132